MARVWVRRKQCGMRNPPRVTERWIGARGAVLDGDGGSGRRVSPVLAWSGSYGAPRVKASSEKGMAGLGVLTKVWSGRGRDAGGAGGEIR